MSILTQLGIADNRDRLHEETLYNLAACYGLAEKRIDLTLKPFGLSAVTMNALLTIKHIGDDGGISQSDIAKRMIVSAGNITRLIDRLEKQGLARRAVSRHDRRINRIFITSEGSKLLDRAWPHYIECVDVMVSVLPKGQIKTVASVLEHFREKLSTGAVSQRRVS